MEAPIARALDLESARQGKPFKDAIQVRAKIDAAIKANKKRLQVGDDVVCRHGAGKLVQYDSAYDSSSDDEEGPCAVEMIVSGQKHVAQFKNSGKSKGGARLRRVPISLAHRPRRSRKDAVPADVHENVFEFFESECATSPCAKHEMR